MSDAHQRERSRAEAEGALYGSPYPSYCCPHCGDFIGWIGRFLQAIRFPVRGHYCPHDGRGQA